MLLMLKFSLSLITVLFLTACTENHDGEDVQAPFDPALSQYRIVQYINATRPGPRQIMELDNNGDILLACLDGGTRDKLDSLGIPWSDSQLELLEVYRLLERSGKKYQTSFPILGPDVMKALRKDMLELSNTISPLIEQDCKDLVNHLLDQGWEKNAYSVVFAYLLDGRIWDEFDNEGLMPDLTISGDQPHWAGETWALYPPREFSTGRNSYWHEGIVFSTAWNKDILPKLRQLWSDRDMFKAMMEDFSPDQKIDDPDILAAYRKFNILDEAGRPAVPVIQADDTDHVYRSSKNIAKKLSDSILAELDLDNMMSIYGFRSEGQALIVIYHELMWDITDYLLEKGVIELPLAFSEPDAATEADIAALAFFSIPSQ